jgi:hypothetical protein
MEIDKKQCVLSKIIRNFVELFLENMALFKTLLVVLTISNSVISSPYGIPATTIKEKLSAPPVGWVHDVAHKINKDAALIKLRINLVEQNMDKFHETVIRVRLYPIMQMCPILG